MNWFAMMWLEWYNYYYKHKYFLALSIKSLAFFMCAMVQSGYKVYSMFRTMIDAFI